MSGWLIALIAVGGVLLLLLLILFCGVAQLRVRCRDEVKVTAGVLGLRFRLYPQKEQDTSPRSFCRSPNRALAKELRRLKREAKRAEKKRKRKQAKAAQKADLPKPNLRENLAMIHALSKEFYRVSKGKIHIRTLRMRIVVATDNAATTALVWGGVSASASMLLGWLDEHFAPIEHYPGEVDIRPDFAGGESGADIDLVFSLSLWRALRIALAMRTSYGEEKTKAQIKAIRRVKKNAAAKKEQSQV